MVYRDREYIEDIDGSTRIRMSDLASIEDYSSNSMEGWVLKALSAMGPTSISRIESWISSNGGPRGEPHKGPIDAIWIMLDEGYLERA